MESHEIREAIDSVDNVYAKDLLDDLEVRKYLVEGAGKYVFKDAVPSLARIAVERKWYGTPKSIKEMFFEMCEEWVATSFSSKELRKD